MPHIQSSVVPSLQAVNWRTSPLLPSPSDFVSLLLLHVECGRNLRKTFDLRCAADKSQTLRPRGAFPAAAAAAAAAAVPTATDSHPKPRVRPGIPEEALLDEDAFFRCAIQTTAGVVSVTVVGGVTAEKNAWPWMALIGTREEPSVKWFCGGVLINEQWVLSALHCFFDDMEGTYVVRLGEHDYNDDGDGAVHENFDVAELIVYPGYSHPEFYHDLILLRLAARVTLKTFINPVCLPWGPESSVDLLGQSVTLTGWGDTAFFGFPSSILQEVTLSVFPTEQCDSSYSTLLDYPMLWPQGIGEETVCAGNPEGGKDACQGDSGGPIVSRDSAGRYTLAGIVSRGLGCGLKDFPGLYVNLRHSPYLAWIKKVAF